MKWPIVTIGDYLVPSELRDPTKNPRTFFRYVDVSSIDNKAFAIWQYTELLGEDAPSRARKVIRSGDVIFATVRPTLRRVALVDASLDNQICSTGFCVLRVGPDLDPGFLYYWLLTDKVVEHAAKIEKGVSYPAIRDSDVKAIQMPYPPLTEQRQIALVLSAVQRAIERQERLIALTAELKKALMHKLFTEGTRSEPLKHTGFGPVPESWKVERLRNFMKIRHGYAFDGRFFRNEGQQILMTPGHFQEAGGFRDQGAKTKFYVGEVPDGYKLAAGDLLVAMTEQKAGLIGSAAFVPKSGTYLHNQRLGLVTALDETQLTKEYLYFFLNRPETKAEVGRTAAGSKVRHTSPGKLLDLLIALPTLKEQVLMSRALGSVDQKLKVHASILDALTHLFRALLHQLMTAQVRVHELDLSPLDELAAKAAEVT